MTFKIEITKTVTETVEFNIVEALRLIATATFRDFTKIDWYGYAGCNTSNPKIADIEWYDLKGDVILDGDTFEFHFHDEIGNCDTFTIMLDNNSMKYQRT